MRLKDIIFSDMISSINPRDGRKETMKGRIKMDVVMV
jgi:hypothetical protein